MMTTSRLRVRRVSVPGRALLLPLPQSPRRARWLVLARTLGRRKSVFKGGWLQQSVFAGGGVLIQVTEAGAVAWTNPVRPSACVGLGGGAASSALMKAPGRDGLGWRTTNWWCEYSEDNGYVKRGWIAIYVGKMRYARMNERSRTQHIFDLVSWPL